MSPLTGRKAVPSGLSGAGRRGALRDESGQALIYVALVLAVLVTVLLALFDLGRLVTAKIRAQNAADAAALAAVSVKVSVHHTRELAYIAMTGQAVRARIELLNAMGNLDNDAEFNRRLARAEAYIKRIEGLRKDLLAYNAWVDQAGPAIVEEAARLAYVANIQGMNDHAASGRALELKNFEAIKAPGALRENSNLSSFVADVNYVNQGLGPKKGAGKSFVEVVPQYQGLNWSIFGFGGIGGPVDVPAWAAAGYASGHEIEKDLAAKGKKLRLGPATVRWYSPRLIRTGQKQDGSFGSPGAGGNIVSEH